jgi:HD-like signal output (HDOD) protein
MEHEEEGSQPQVVKSLLKKLDNSPGFSGLEGTAQTVGSLIENDGGTHQIVSAILRDPTLTSKLLHIANSSSNARGGRNISTIDQAMAILGLNTVKSTGLSLLSLRSITRKTQLDFLHAETVAAYFCGILAAEITRFNGATYNVQEAQICGLMQNLGRMLSLFYLYDELECSRKLQTDQNLTESDALLQTLGVSFEQIGAAVADHWGLPDVLQNSLLSDVFKSPPQVLANASDWNQQCSFFCRRVTEVLFRMPENREKIEIINSINFFQKTLKLVEKDMLPLIEKCLLDTDSMLAESGVSANVEDAKILLKKASDRSLDMLTSHDSLVKKVNDGSDQSPIETVKHLMRQIHHHCNFDCTLICLPSGPSGLVAIAGVGRNAGNLTTKFRSSGLKQDIFRIIIDRKTDVFIGDVHKPPFASLIPGWYHEIVGANSFMMLTLVSEGKLLGIVYGDYAKTRTTAPPGMASGSMLEWRNQLIHTLVTGPKRTRRVTLSLS